MADEDKEQFVVQEEVEVEVPPPSTRPDKLVETKRDAPIVRQQPLTETHGMTTEAERFRTD